jgi:hypothetical protein
VREWVMDVADGLHGLAHGGRLDEPALRPDRGERHPGRGEAGREDAREQEPDGSEIGATARDRPRLEPDESRTDGRAGREGERVSLRERLAEAMRERSRANRERARELGRGRDTGLSR